MNYEALPPEGAITICENIFIIYEIPPTFFYIDIFLPEEPIGPFMTHPRLRSMIEKPALIWILNNREMPIHFEFVDFGFQKNKAYRCLLKFEEY